MAKITGGESNLLNGVSQQPVDRRLRGSLQSLVNTRTDILSGIERSPALDFNPIDVGPTTYSKVTWRDFVLDGTNYLMRVEYEKDSTSELLIELIDGDNNRSTLNVPDVHIPYLTSMDEDALQITATDDGVYLLNPNVVTAMTTQVSLPPYGAYIDMTGTNYGRTYEISVNGSTPATATIPADTTGLDPEDIQSEAIMEDLHTQLNALNDITSVITGSTIFLVPTINTYEYLDIEVKDGDNNNYLQVSQRVIPSTSKLPKAAVQDSILTIRPNDGGKESEYYLKYADKQTIYDNESIDPIPVPDVVEWEDTHVLNTDLIFVNPTINERAYTTSYGPTGGGSLSPNTFFGGEILDLIVSTTSYDSGQLDGGFVQYDDQLITMIVDWTNTDEAAPDHIMLELGTRLYKLEKQSATTYRTTTDISDYSLNPYGYVKNNINISMTLRSDSSPDVTNMYQGGIWIEALQPGLDYRINPSTMPLKASLVNDEWSVDIVNWKERRVGNEENNKIPSFIGKSINAIAFIQSRLCFLTDDSVVFSRVDYETDFWRRSATTVVDDDRVDIESRLLDTGPFRSLAAHDKDIVIMGDTEQWVIRTANGITPSSTILQIASRYENDAHIAPTSLGSSIAYPVWDGTYSQLREFYTRDDTGANDSEYLTSIVPTYLKGRVKRIASTTLHNHLIVQTDEPNTLYIMQWHNQNNARVMQSWHKWELPATPEYFWFVSGTLYLVMNDGLVTRISSVNLAGDTYAGLPYNIYLHYRAIHQVSNNTLTLPDDHPYNNTDSVVVGAHDSTYPAMSIPFNITGNTVTLDDSLGTTFTGSWVIGNKYTSSIELSKVLPRDMEDRVIADSTLRLNNIKLRHKDSGPYTVNVIRSWGDYYNDVQSVDMTRRVGAAMINTALVDTGELRASIRERSEYVTINITTDSHLPYNLTGYDWSGQISGSGQRSNF